MKNGQSGLKALIRIALEEDHVANDITTRLLFPDPVPAAASIIAKEDMVLAGIDVARQVFKQVDRRLRFSRSCRDGDSVKAGTTCCTIRGDARSLLSAERVALNFLQHLSGIASLTHQFQRHMRGRNTQILDTRKTTPGLRMLQKMAVKLGGGRNHRMSLKDGILIKDNHLAILKSLGIDITEACRKVKKRSHLKICVETESLPQVEAAVKGGADIIMLDNMSPRMLRKAIRLINGRALTEISGGVTLKNIATIARVGADFISIGALTHSARAMDLSLALDPLPSGR
ncbi:MAG: carboxylating nicotinate-nucleotide diphosphorylase [Nitrospira sp.]|nr:carboxylating nicotinate-nucleotide diphosphorylase [Nitrospira sp.]